MIFYVKICQVLELFVLPSCWAMNSQVSHVTGFSPYEMVYHQTPPDLFNFDFDPEKTGLKNRYKQLFGIDETEKRNYG